jgi:hypothetical protein
LLNDRLLLFKECQEKFTQLLRHRANEFNLRHSDVEVLALSLRLWYGVADSNKDVASELSKLSINTWVDTLNNEISGKIKLPAKNCILEAAQAAASCAWKSFVEKSPGRQHTSAPVQRENTTPTEEICWSVILSRKVWGPGTIIRLPTHLQTSRNVTYDPSQDTTKLNGGE